MRPKQKWNSQKNCVTGFDGWEFYIQRACAHARFWMRLRFKDFGLLHSPTDSTEFGRSFFFIPLLFLPFDRMTRQISFGWFIKCIFYVYELWLITVTHIIISHDRKILTHAHIIIIIINEGLNYGSTSNLSQILSLIYFKLCSIEHIGHIQSCIQWQPNGYDCGFNRMRVLFFLSHSVE